MVQPAATEQEHQPDTPARVPRYHELVRELEDLGVQITEVSGDFVKYTAKVPSQYNHTLPAKNEPKSSHNDYLALAKQKSCTLLTGDINLRIVASKEQVTALESPSDCCAPWSRTSY